MDGGIQMQNFDLFRLDGHTLRVFVSVCETGSVSRTAELFELNQSTISHTLDTNHAHARRRTCCAGRDALERPDTQRARVHR